MGYSLLPETNEILKMDAKPILSLHCFNLSTKMMFTYLPLVDILLVL